MLSRLLDYLPALYHDDPFLGQFLLAFEKILLGSKELPDLAQTGLEETIDRIPQYFDPQSVPPEFISWLASWTAFSLRADLPIAKQREFIAQIIPLYQRRGTPENLIKLLKIFTTTNPQISEPEPLQVRRRFTLGVDAYIGGSPPHFFVITLSFLGRLSPAELGRQAAIAQALIDLEKPAHTTYDLKYQFPSLFEVGNARVGVDTLIGSIPTA